MDREEGERRRDGERSGRLKGMKIERREYKEK